MTMSHLFLSGCTRRNNYLRFNTLNARVYQEPSSSKQSTSKEINLGKFSSKQSSSKESNLEKSTLKEPNSMESNLEKSSSKEVNSEESTSKEINSQISYSETFNQKELESNGTKSSEPKINEPETDEPKTKETNWSIDISSILKDQKFALTEIKEKLELDEDALLNALQTEDKLPTNTLMFCANIIGIVRHLEKRFELSCKYKLTKAQKRYIENGSSEKEKLIRRQTLKWQCLLKQDFYRPLCSALEEKQISLQQFCRSIGVVHQTLNDIVKSQSKYTPVAVPPIPGEIQCSSEHVECFKIFLDILK